MQPLKNELSRSAMSCSCSTILKPRRISENATAHSDNTFVQQFCSTCEMQDDKEMDCVRSGRRRYLFYDDPAGHLLSYLCELQPWCNKVIAITHNAKAFDSQFILKRAILMKWNRELILSGLKIIIMKMQHIHFLDSISYLPMSLLKLPEAFGLSSQKSYFPHYFNTKAN
jgi:hypothetical protein